MTTVKATDSNNERAQPRRFEKKTNMASIYPAIVIGPRNRSRLGADRA